MFRPASGSDELIKRELQPQFRGEQVSAAWRYDRAPGESDASFNARAQAGSVTTLYHDEKRQSDGKLVTKADGTVELGDGSSAEGTRNYAMDPVTGDIATGRGWHRVAALGPDGRPNGNFVPQGELVDDILAAMKSGGRQRVEAEHHSSLLAGRDVAAAGTVTVQGGKVTQVSNESGHYKPEFGHLLQAVEALTRTGAMLDTRITDAEGNDLKTTNPRAFSAWQKVGVLEAAVRKKAENLESLLNNVDDPMCSEAEQAKAVADLDQLHNDMTKLMQSKALLRKAGIGPANRLAGNVKVVFASAQPGGAAPAAPAGSATVSTKEFLTGTANPNADAPLRDAAGRKALMQDIRVPVATEGPDPVADAQARADLQRQLEALDTGLSEAPAVKEAAAAGAAAATFGAYDTVKPDAGAAQPPDAPAGSQNYGNVPRGMPGNRPGGENGPLPPTPGGGTDNDPATLGPLPPTPT